jgi:N-acetylglucosamine kinase-like BadF-type ATPase
MKPCVLGVDGGNTKTLAVVASTAGTVLGVGRAGCADIYGAGDPELAIAEIATAAAAAMSAAGVGADDLSHAAFSLAGADWQEDATFLGDELKRRLGLASASVVNDAIGALWLGGGDAVGVAVIVGTGAAIGARNSSGETYHLGWWPERMGGGALGAAGWRAVYRSHLGIGPETSLTPRALALYGVADPIGLLHELTRRGGIGITALRRLAPAVLDEAAAGDAVAAEIIAVQGEHLAEIAEHCAGRVGLAGSRHPLVLAGGVLAHPASGFLIDPVLHRLPEAVPVRPGRPPVVGALRLACERAGATPSVADFEIEA